MRPLLREPNARQGAGVLSRWWFERLVCLYPSTFRAAYRGDLIAAFDESVRLLRGRFGRLAPLMAALCATADAIGAGVALRRQHPGPVHLNRDKRRRNSFEPGLPFSGKDGPMSAIVTDLHHAWRRVRSSPRFAAAATLTLALGLGFNVALFAVVDATVLRPIRYESSARLMFLWAGRFEGGTPSVNSYADFLDWQARSRTFQAMAVYNVSTAAFSDGGDPEEIRGATVSPEFFQVMRAPLLLGRALRTGDNLVTGEQPIVISEALWQRRFGRDPSIVGRIITVAEVRREVVGVMAGSFQHPNPFSIQPAEYWSPLVVTTALRQYRAMRFLRVIGRLRDGITPGQAGSEMNAIGNQLMREHPETNPRSVILVSVRQQFLRDTGPIFLLFVAAVTLALSLACASIVNLLMARVGGRHVEFAVRASLGASRGRLVRQVLFEGALLGAVAGAIGLAVGAPTARILAGLMPIRLMGLDRVGMSVRLVVVSLGLSLVAGVLCAIGPALTVARARFAADLSGARTVSPLAASRARTWLVAVEMALAVPLLVGSGLLVQTLINVQRVRLGFEPDGVLYFQTTLTGSRYASEAARHQLAAKATSPSAPADTTTVCGSGGATW
jgi:putative ABC transport system permease protein